MTPEIVELLTYVTSLAPGLAGIIGMIFAVIILVKRITDAINTYKDTEECRQLIERLRTFERENIRLREDNKEIKRELKEVLTKMTGVQHDSDGKV